MHPDRLIRYLRFVLVLAIDDRYALVVLIRLIRDVCRAQQRKHIHDITTAVY